MDPVRSLCYIGPRMGHVIVYPTGCILGRASCTKETLSIFVKLWVLVKGNNSVVSGYPTSTSFLRVDAWSTDPRVLGRHTPLLDFR